MKKIGAGTDEPNKLRYLPISLISFCLILSGATSKSTSEALTNSSSRIFLLQKSRNAFTLGNDLIPNALG